MKVKIIENTYKREKTKMPAIFGISLKSGCCRFTKTATKLTELKALDKIVFVQNEEDKRDWYFRLAKDNEIGFVLRNNKGSSSAEILLFNSMALVCLIADSLSFIGKSAKCNISNELVDIDGVEHWQLITGMIKNK